MRVKAIRAHANGGPEVLRWEDHELAPPAAGQVLVRHTAIALNFSDVNVRRGGFYIAKPVEFPLILGNEAVGTVEALGAGVSGFSVGDRVAYVGSGGPFYEDTGSYAEARCVPASCLVPLPADLPDDLVAASLMKALTAALVITVLYRPKPGDRVLVHGAASGVGLLLVQWAKHLGATVLGTVGSPEKAALARANGCEHPILYRDEDFVAAAKRIAPKGVDAVLDGVGKDTFIPSFDCTRRYGTLVNYGNASGHVPPFDLLLLAKKGSLSVSRAGVTSLVGNAEELRGASATVFERLREGVLRPHLGARYALKDAATAHRDLEARRIAGAAVLIP